MRRMIPTKLIEWIKKLFNNVQPNGDNVEFGKDIEVDGVVYADKIKDRVGVEGVHTTIDLGTTDISTNANLNIGESQNTKDLYVSGKIKDYGKIVDEDNNFRFAKGDISINANMTTLGCSKAYGKWALSGNHLMVVFAMTIPADTTLPVYDRNIANFTLPQYVLDKLFTLIEGVDIVHRYSANIYNSSTDVANTIPVILWKESTGMRISYSIASPIVLTTKSVCRIEFDFIIE